jgi:hypothetical protein
MKKLLFLFSALVFISCSGDDNDYSLVEDNTTNSDSNSTDTGNNSNNLYIIELKKIFKSKQHYLKTYINIGGVIIMNMAQATKNIAH